LHGTHHLHHKRLSWQTVQRSTKRGCLEHTSTK
jgi:hypothetical protein